MKIPAAADIMEKLGMSDHQAELFNSVAIAHGLPIRMPNRSILHEHAARYTPDYAFLRMSLLGKTAVAVEEDDDEASIRLHVGRTTDWKFQEESEDPG